MTATDPSDTSAFLDLARTKKDLFSAGELIITRAPGRLDVMGGIADYSGSLVLPFPIAAATHAAIQLHDERLVRIHSVSEGSLREFEMSLAAFMSNDGPITYDEARAIFKPDAWAAYVAGAFLVLMREKQVTFGQGASIFLHSDVPEGKGVSSSAALEVASMMAIAGAYDIQLSPTEVALLCQKVENLIAGAPCGVMDQMTAVFGESDHFLSLLCQPAQLNGTIPLPEELGVWGIDSGIRHSVGGADYTSVRTAAFMGYRIICEVDGEKWNDYLANITPAEFDERFEAKLPEEISGREFLEKYGGINDSVTTVNPEQIYQVARATRHPVYENARVRLFADLLQQYEGWHHAELLGQLMYQSHKSYSMCGLGSSGTDELVKLVRFNGMRSGFYGARITGGGSGGTVAVLGDRNEAPESIARIVEEYAEQTGYRPMVIWGSSSGAAVFGHRSLRIMTD